METLLLAEVVGVLGQQVRVETHRVFLEALVEATLDILEELVDLVHLGKVIMAESEHRLEAAAEGVLVL
jgi:hypothetical protein